MGEGVCLYVMTETAGDHTPPVASLWRSHEPGPLGRAALGHECKPRTGTVTAFKTSVFNPKATDIWGSTDATTQQALINMHLQWTRIFLKDSSPSS